MRCISDRRQGGHTGAVPSQLTACAPPSEDCAPKKLTGSGLLECKSRPKLVFFEDWHRISWRFWDKELFFFFFWDHLFSAGKTAWISDFGRKIPCNFSEDVFFWRSPVFGQKTAWISDFGRKIPCNFSEDLFFSFLEITCFRSEKPLEFPISAAVCSNLCSSPCSFDPDCDKFLVPLSNSHKINFSCPPKIYFCPPSHAILAPGLVYIILK